MQTAKFTKNFKHIIDSYNRRLALNDPRIVHVWPTCFSPNTAMMLKSVYDKRGWNFRYTGEVSEQTLRYARELCSGRECFSFMAMAGETYRDIVQQRNQDEVSIYYNLDNVGVCQAGAWPLAWEVFSKQIKKSNIIYCAQPNIANNYFGQGEWFATQIIAAVIIGEILDEVQNVLACLAIDKNQAFELFNAQAAILAKGFRKGFLAMESALKDWAVHLSQIPLSATIDQTPRVFVFSGIGVYFIQHQVSAYFIEQGIIPKVEDFSTGFQFLEGMLAVDNGLQRGCVDIKDHFGITSLLLGLFDINSTVGKSIKSLRATVHIRMIDFLKRRYRSIAGRSGLLIHPEIAFKDIIRQGDRHVSYSSNVEMPIPCGLYAIFAQNRVYDGLVNACYFNCQQSMSSQSVIRSLSYKSDIPFISLDLDSPNITANQRKLLEAMAFQVKREHFEKHLA